MQKPKHTNTTSVAGATTALVLLTALNFVNYIDRYILPGVQEQIKQEFFLSDKQIGSLTFWFMIAYMGTSPITGWLGDRFPRNTMIVIAALFWSGINFFTASVHSYDSLNMNHAALGVGEASFGIFAPAVLSDFYPEDQRNRVLTIFNIAPLRRRSSRLPHRRRGGRALRLAQILHRIRYPRHPHRNPHRNFYRRLGAQRRANTKNHLGGGNCPLTPQEQGVSVLNPRLRCRHLLAWRHLLVDALVPPARRRTQRILAAYLMGVITLCGGLGGTIFGGFVAQRWSRTNSKALYLVPAISSALAVPPALLCFFGPHSSR